MLPAPKPGQTQASPYQGAFYQRFRRLLSLAIRYRVLFLGSLMGLLVLSVLGFRFVPQLYFPDSSRLQIMIDYWAPEGTRIQQTSAGLEKIEKYLQEHPAVASVSTFIGKGPPRFYLPVSAEDPYTSYAQLIVNTKTLSGVNQLVADTDAWVRENVPEAMVRVRKYAVGAFDDWKIEARFSGPANADPATLRRLAEEGANILRDCPYAKEVRTNWREQVQALAPRYNQERGRWARVSRDDLARTTRRASDGVVVGQYRQEDDLIPIVARNVEQERQRAATSLEDFQITPRLSSHAVPVSQVVDGIATPWEDPIIWRWDRRRAITVQCSPNGVTAPTLRNAVLAKFEAIKLPPGYRLDWDGEYWSAKQSQEALAAGNRAGSGDHAVHPRRPVQRIPAHADLHPGHPLRDDRNHGRAADDRHAVRLHRTFGSHEPFGNDDQERRGAAGRGQCQSCSVDSLPTTRSSRRPSPG